MGKSTTRHEGSRVSPRMRTLAIAIVLVFTLGTILAYVAWDRTDSIVAVVNGERIYRQQLDDQLMARHGKALLDQIIQETLIRQRAREVGIVVTSDDIDQEIAEIRDQFSSDEEFQHVLAEYGMTESDLRTRIEIESLVEKLVVHDFLIDVTTEQAQEFFEENLYLFEEAEYVVARHILVNSEEEALEILGLLNDGADFAELATEHSLDPGSGPQGGSLGIVLRGQMVPEFEEAAFSLRAGEMSDIVQTTFGYHIILVEEHKPALVPTYDQVSDEVRSRLLSQMARERMREWLEMVKANSTIEYNIRW